MAPDTQQNIFYTVYFLILHNWQPMFYFSGLIVSFGWSYWKPSRGKILFLLGFALLLFAFEYSKHIEDPLVEQTRNSLITERQNYKVERVIHLALSRAIPIGLPILGWSIIGVGSWHELTSRRKRYNDQEDRRS